MPAALHQTPAGPTQLAMVAVVCALASLPGLQQLHPPPEPQEPDPLCVPLAQVSGLSHSGGSLRTRVLPPWESPALDTSRRPEDVRAASSSPRLPRGSSVLRQCALPPGGQLSGLVSLLPAWPPSSILSPGFGHVLCPPWFPPREWPGGGSMFSEWRGVSQSFRQRTGSRVTASRQVMGFSLGKC